MLILQVLLLVAAICYINARAAPQHPPLENGEPVVWEEYIDQIITDNFTHDDILPPVDQVPDPDPFNKEQLETIGKLTQGPNEGTAGTFTMLWISIGAGLVFLFLGGTAFIYKQRWRQKEAEARRRHLHPVVNHGFNGVDEIPPGRAGLKWNISLTSLHTIGQFHFPLPQIYPITPNHRLIIFFGPDSVWLATLCDMGPTEIVRRLPLYPLGINPRKFHLPSIFRVLTTPVDKTILRNYHPVVPSTRRRWSLGSVDALVKSPESPYYQWPDAAKYPESPYCEGPEVIPRYYGSGIKRSCSEEQLSNLQK